MSGPSESLFDTKFTAEKASTTPSGEPEQEQVSTVQDSTVQDSHIQDSTQTADEVLPVDLELNTALINYRILVTRREAGVIIGKNGDSITEIRDSNNVKAGVSKLVEGCVDRILTISGAVDDVAQLIGLFANNLIENNKNLSTPVTPYSFFPLRPLCPPSNSDDVVALRLMIPNSQMGALIGKQGVRIKLIQETYNVKLVASKDTLINSTERIVEIQGTSSAITSLMKIISKCLLEDFQTPTGIIYYNPSPRNPHRPSYPPTGSYNNGGSSNGVPPSGGKQITERVGFPQDMVGALIGKRGSRIQEVRRNSGCNIIIDVENNEEGERMFTLTGSSFNVEKALAMLYNYLEREQLRRAE